MLIGIDMLKIAELFRTDGAGNRKEDTHSQRIRLLRDVVLFQFKLAADGLRDILLSPLSIGSAIIGLIFAGDEPDRYFRRLERLGRKSDIWINLFNQSRRGTTANSLLEPLERKVIEEYQRGGWLADYSGRVNKALDGLNRNLAAGDRGGRVGDPGANGVQRTPDELEKGPRTAD